MPIFVTLVQLMFSYNERKGSHNKLSYPLALSVPSFAIVSWDYMKLFYKYAYWGLALKFDVVFSVMMTDEDYTYLWI